MRGMQANPQMVGPYRRRSDGELAAFLKAEDAVVIGAEDDDGDRLMRAWESATTIEKGN